MTKLSLDAINFDTLSSEEMNESPKGFWRRQFQKKATAKQIKFDWFFGVFLPVICFVFDPIIFEDKDFLGNYKAFAYLLSFVSVMAMSAWLIWGEKLKWLNAFLAGLFIVGSFISFGIGIIIFPISLIGLIVLIGALGFTPLFSAIVFLRNSIRAYRAAKPFLEKKILVYSFLLSALFTAVIPSVINVEVNKFKQKKMKEHISTPTRIFTD